MATTYTPNYNLGKQTDPNDNFDMSVITANMDTIDTQMKTNADNIALAQQSIDDLSPVLTQILNTVGGIEQTTNTINTNVTDIKNGIGDTAEILELILSGYKGASSKVNFYDYDGSVLYSYTKDEFLALTEMPSNPSHEGLTAQGWNLSFADAKTYVTNNGKLDIGQMYVTDDGSTRLHIRLGEGRLKPYLGLTGNSSGTTVSIDWGDGSTVESVTLNTSTVYTPHEYTSAGEYTISISVTTGSITLNGDSSYYSNILRKSSSPNVNNDRVYQNSLISIEIGNNVSFGGRAFQYCYSLQSITIPDSVTSIGNYAFQGCYSLQSITIPDSVTSIGQYTFQNCTSLTSITIPDGATSIDSNAFQYCFSLQSITIPDGVTSISGSAFSDCSSMTSVTIPDGVTSIGGNAFASCRSLTSIIIPDTVTSIGQSAFNYCFSLSSITIPDGVTSIGSYAFQYCYGLGSIKFTSTTPPTVSSSAAWTGVPTDCIIYVPSGTLTAYTTKTNYPSPSSYTYIEY